MRDFFEENFHHFNAGRLKRACSDLELHLANDGKIILTIAGAMSTAKMSPIIAKLIRQQKVHAISTTGANLEEDLFRLIANDHYQDLYDWETLSPEGEKSLFDKGLNRVTDTCIPEHIAIERMEEVLLPLWKRLDEENSTLSPSEMFFEVLDQPQFQKLFQLPKESSWILAAKESDIPIFCPGWEDSSIGNAFTSFVYRGDLSSTKIIRHGCDTMIDLLKWYQDHSLDHSMGFLQIGGGIAGDFPVCVVPILNLDLHKNVPKWQYFCQISDSTTSYGSYSGAHPNEKISWGKLDLSSKRHKIESDATIVFPLMAEYLLSQNN